MASPLTLADLGEDALVEHLLRLLPPLPPSVELGPGDDCAMVVPASPLELRELLKVDSVVEGVHFALGEDMSRVGWKALCRTISDIAAMGGTPRHALITLAVRPRTLVSDLTALYRGLAKAAQVYGVAVVGGETGHTEGPLVCSVFVTGSVPAGACVTRSGGRPGDALFVTGRLGGSLQSGWHLDFTPRLREAQWLAAHALLTAMMDLSDGLAADLPRLARASGCGVEVWPECVPCREGFGIAEAFGDGEDFELLFALPSERVAALQAGWHRDFAGVPLTQIGRLTDAGTGFSPSQFFSKGGYDHFQ